MSPRERETVTGQQTSIAKEKGKARSAGVAKIARLPDASGYRRPSNKVAVKAAVANQQGLQGKQGRLSMSK